jgi:hypothetical protein
MSLHFQFAFLGCHNDYVASVTSLVTTSFPLAASDLVW